MMAKTISKHGPDASAIRDAMLGWYDRHRRVLPWRAEPGVVPDPYRVWLSEVMLQQTTVQAVIPYFMKFVTLWPDIKALAAAPQDDIMREWAGLGYYSRARNLHKCAVTVADDFDGQFPQDPAALKSLPGIGDYTAAAIRSIAFNRPATVIDGNIERVVSRLYRIDIPLPEAKPVIRHYAAPLFEGDNTARPSCFAQSLMDLGASICTPKSPKCGVCPINQWCAAHASEGMAEIYPMRKEKASLPQKHGHAFLYIDSGNKKVLVEKRPEKGMLGGMTGFPTGEWTDAGIPLPDMPGAVQNRKVKHVFTHFALTLTPVVVKMSENDNGTIATGRWVGFSEIETAGLPTLFKKLWKLMKDHPDMLY